MDEVARVLEAKTVEGARDERLWGHLRTFLWVSGVLFFLGAMGSGIWALWTAWQTAFWDDFWRSFTQPLGTVIVFWIAPKTLVRRNWLAWVKDGVGVLRRAAVQGNEEVAPRATDQPEPLSGSNMPVGAVEYGPFRYANPDRTLELSAAGAILGLIGALSVTIGVALVLTLTTNVEPRAPIRHDDPVFAWSLALGLNALGASLLGAAALFLWRAWRRRRGEGLVADDWGIRVAGRDEEGIAWHEARAFFEFRIGGKGHWSARWVYGLDAGDRLIVWAVPGTESSTIRARHEQLCRLIVTRTRLALRDMTKPAAILVETKNDRRSRRVMAGYSPAATGAPSIFGAPRPTWTCGVIVLLAMPLLLMGLLYGSGWGLQRIQARQYGSLVERIHAERPLFHVAGMVSEQSLDELASQTYGNVAVEVTVRQSRSGVNIEGDGIGLMLRQSDIPSAEVVFTVDSVGQWSILRLANNESADRPDPYAIVSEHSDAIHTGAGAANRLLVLMRGQQYLCFINYQFVGAYYENLLVAGKVGLGQGDAATIAMFTDLTVYPAV